MGIQSPLIIFFSASLNLQRPFVRLFPGHPVEGVSCVCTCSLFIPAFSRSLLHPLSLHSGLSLLYSFLQHLSSISSLSPPSVLLTQRTVSRPRSSPSSLPGRKNKQASTCSHGILMTSITLASSPAKPQAARGSGDGPVYQHWWPVLWTWAKKYPLKGFQSIFLSHKSNTFSLKLDFTHSIAA